MAQAIYKQKQNNRLILRKNWRLWLKLAGIWKGKKAIDPLRWQKKIRLDRN